MSSQGRKTPLRWASALAAPLGFQSAAPAQRVDGAAYAYPYRDAYLATATVAILKDRDHDAVHDPNRYLRLELIPGRDAVPLLEGQGRLRVRYTPQKGPAPLVFLIPGFGGSAYAGSTRYVAQLLADHGFHVLALPSPFNWNFALAASRSGLPGRTGPDSEDLYLAMQAALRHVRERFHPEIAGIGLIGLSHGALHAAHIAGLDARRNAIGFGRVLLVNPPIDPLRAILAIDRLADSGDRYTAGKKDY